MKFTLLLLLVVTFVFGGVDINNASKSELISLHGIGVKKAEAILVYRKEHCFSTVEEIVKVKGVGKKTFEKNRGKMEAGACK